MDGKLLEARAAMSICAQRSCQPAVVEDCIQWLPQLDRQIPSVVLAAKSDQGDETRVSVYVDDVLVAERLDGRPLDLDPGTYRIRFVWGTAKPIERAVLLREGEKYRQVIADFRSAPKVRPLAGGVSKQAPRRETRPVPGAVYVLGSVGAVAVATSAVMALSARSARTEALSSCAPLCEQTEVDSVRGKALAADIAGGIGLVSLGLAGYMYWTRPTVYEPVLAPSQSGWVFGLRGRY